MNEVVFERIYKEKMAKEALDVLKKTYKGVEKVKMVLLRLYE